MPNARQPSREHSTLPKDVADRLGRRKKKSVGVGARADDVVPKELLAGSWRELEGRLRGSDLLGDLARNRLKELAHERKRS
jgi:hypothetical protein